MRWAAVQKLAAAGQPSMGMGSMMNPMMRMGRGMPGMGMGMGGMGMGGMGMGGQGDMSGGGGGGGGGPGMEGIYFKTRICNK